MDDSTPLKPTPQLLRQELYFSLAESRYDAGLTQAGLAERTGISQSKIARIENGTMNPTVNTILKLAEALEVWVSLTPANPKRYYLL